MREAMSEAKDDSNGQERRCYVTVKKDRAVPVNVVHGVEREVEHDDVVDLRDIKSSSGQISAHQKLLLAFSEFVQIGLSDIGDKRRKDII